MSSSTTNPFSGMFPGFDFKAPAGASLPMAGWMPTLDPKELDGRINELKTVLFWLEQNATIVKSTIQALEVQKMTLGTLSSMNLGMAEFAKALSAPAAGAAATGKAQQGAAAAPMAAGWPLGAGTGASAAAPAQAGAADAGSKDDAAKLAAQAAASMAIPAQMSQMWWNALGSQCQQLYAKTAQQQAAMEAAMAAAASHTKPQPKDGGDGAGSIDEGGTEAAKPAAVRKKAAPGGKADK